MLRIVVLGVGNFGHFFTRRLAAQKVEILAIDGDKEAIDAIATHVTHAVVGDCTNRDLLVGSRSRSVGEEIRERSATESRSG